MIKLGSSTVIDSKNGFRTDELRPLVADLAQCRQNGIEVILVSSGAIGLGRNRIQEKPQLTSLARKQALASIGQAALINHYSSLFQEHNIHVGQILITTGDLAQRNQYINLRNSLNELIALNAIPIINENDCTSTSELESTKDRGFGDNDVLAALVAAKLNVDIFIILTTVDGLYSSPPTHPSELPINEVRDLKDLSKINVGEVSELGRGGAASKIEAASIASKCGIYTVIANGNIPHIVDKILNSDNKPGTHVFPSGHLSAKKKMDWFQ
ncbi:MAG: glutamate 5-kinase [Bdellovibrionales bacterium]